MEKNKMYLRIITIFSILFLSLPIFSTNIEEIPEFVGDYIDFKMFILVAIPSFVSGIATVILKGFVTSIIREKTSNKKKYERE